MKTRTASIADYVSGEEALPATFTTAYKRDLAVARQIVQRRLHGAVAPEAPQNNDQQHEALVDTRPLPAST